MHTKKMCGLTVKAMDKFLLIITSLKSIWKHLGFCKKAIDRFEQGLCWMLGFCNDLAFSVFNLYNSSFDLQICCCILWRFHTSSVSGFSCTSKKLLQ